MKNSWKVPMFLLILVSALLAGFMPAASFAEDYRWALIIDGPSNVRSGPGTGYSIIYVYQTGERVRIYGSQTSGGWYRTYVNGRKGYIHRSQVRFEGSSTTSSGYRWGVIVDGPSNVRSGPGTDYSIVTVLETGEQVKVYGATQNGWYITYVNGAKAYIHKSQVRLR
jgi:uncharacterized protein YraI